MPCRAVLCHAVLYDSSGSAFRVHHSECICRCMLISRAETSLSAPWARNGLHSRYKHTHTHTHVYVCTVYETTHTYLGLLFAWHSRPRSCIDTTFIPGNAIGSDRLILIASRWSVLDVKDEICRIMVILNLSQLLNRPRQGVR